MVELVVVNRFRVPDAETDMLLVAVHPWDVHGARRAGLRSAWVNRSGGAFPATFLEPTYTIAGVDQLAELWD